MKKIKNVKARILLWFVLGSTTSMALLMSCYGDPISRDLEVETLVSDFAANGAVSVDQEGVIYVSEYGRFVDTGGSGT